jgi:hypothetical protein
MFRDDWVVITPPEGRRAETAAELSALAQHPGHVRTAGGAGEFLVPPYLAAAYMPPAAPEQPRRPRRKKEVEPDGD